MQQGPEKLAEQTEVFRSFVAEGVVLSVVVQKEDSDEWYLWIENELGVKTVWIETYAAARAALNPGVKAIESEGVEVFSEIEGFEYLLES